jgi:hypothetical protein
MQQFDSIKLYTMLQQAENFIKENVGDGKECRLFVFGGYGASDQVRLHLSRGYGNEEIKISGKHLGDMVEEFNRQLGFVQRQQNLAIGSSVVEHEAGEVAGESG